MQTERQTPPATATDTMAMPAITGTIGRSRAEHAARRRMPAGWMARFTAPERGLHWVNSFAFLVLAVTGLSLYFHPLESAANQLLARLPGLFGRLSVTDVHVTAAIIFILNPLVACAVGGRGMVRANARALLHFDRDDRRWLMCMLTFRRPLPPQGRFNAGQKLSAIGLVGAWLAFFVTGMMQLPWPLYERLTGSGGAGGAGGGMPPAGFTPGVAGGAGGAGMPPMGGGAHATGPFGIFHFGMSALETIHNVHALIAVVCVIWLAGHIYLSTLNRHTRHSLWAMTTGRVRRDWALAHHATWVAAVESAGTAESATAAYAPTQGSDAR